ncbi:Acetylornithine/succinyldiaminopimelate aminotransferase [Thermodesulfobacterium geofontis OPF15]|uniref:Acetylornithine aminotransferase n=1 Tax=Thermodesulfobacterium geofontis (strain OPF15) TaxID=795359 RepID=F8C2G4_THEGP|nr:aspartate aminotransferase family protein [Thermodesulfobacterium geofontis]AEH22254.1 Acetylornithine/succinyldiaminopimelate aminotransferase [Thermodesulfobacterium geofontis OPF15]
MGYIVEMGEIYLAGNYKREKLAFVKGSGTRLFTEDGEEYLDFTSGIAVCNLGHANQELIKELNTQAELLWHTSNLYYVSPQAKLAKKLVELSFAEKVFFANSGAEAIEAGLKLARRWAYENFGKEKNQFIALENSFHGRTYGALSVTGQPKYWEGFEPLLPGIIFIPPNDKKALSASFNEKVCAIILEPIQGEGGVYPLDKEFVELAKELCQKYNALLIFDEVQTGIGRTGKLFAYEHFGVEPDIMCLAKALANGLPLSAMLAKEKVMSAFKPGTHASTFGGNPLACAVALKVLEIVSNPSFLKEVDLKGRILKEKLEKIRKERPDLIKEVRGLGLLIGIEFNISAEKIYQKLLEKKILVTQPKPNVIRLSPPLIITYREIDFFMETFKEIITVL